MAKTKRKKTKARNMREMYSGFRNEVAPVTKHHVPKEDPRIVVLAARRRHNNKPQNADMSHEMWGDLAGRAIIIGADGLTDRSAAERRDLAATLWDVFKRLDGCDETYFRRIIGRQRFPNVARMEYLPEAFETRPDDHHGEYRTEDEKDRAAVRNWMRWQGYLGSMSATEHCAIVSALRQRVMLSHAGRLTGAGERFVSAMRRLVEIERLDARRRV